VVMCLDLLESVRPYNAERSRAKRRAEGGAGVTCYVLIQSKLFSTI
jgi:hypothetical protein